MVGKKSVRRATNPKEYILSALPHPPGQEGDLPAKITIRNNGPVRIEGDFEVVDQDGRPFESCRADHHLALPVRQSSNKPFCDGTHREAALNRPSKPGRCRPRPQARVG